MTPFRQNAPSHRPIQPDPWRAVLLGDLTALFAACVLAQTISLLHRVDVLPPFATLQGSVLPNAALLPAQLVILSAMLASTMAVARGSFEHTPARGRILAWCGGLYFAGSVLRLCIGALLPNAAPWFHAWTSDAFHLVLASFLLVLADCYRHPSLDPT